MSEQAYMLEYGAEFGEENQGVFKHTLIDKSMSKYIKNFDSHDTDIFDPEFKQTAGNIYIIGVDWNTYKNGGQVVVVEYCKNPTYIEYYDDKLTKDIRIDCTGKFRLFYRKGIKYKNATQRETRKEIIRLLKEYQIDHIYVDYGAGDTNIEELTFYGKEHPGLGISSKLHVVDSGSTITHYDHLLKEEVKKRAKSLMISLAVVNLEEGRFILPKEEDSDHRLIYQMRNYIIKSTTTKGDFTYDGEDHILDAFILAVYGFNHQYSNLFMPNYKNKLKFIENPMLTYAPRRKQSEISTLESSSSKYRDPEAPVTQLPPWARNRGSSRGSKLFGNGFRKLF